MSQSLRTRTTGTHPSSPPRTESAPRRALVWDAGNSSSLLVARAFVRQGWVVDWMGAPRSPFRASPLWNSRTDLATFEDASLEHVLRSHPLDALLLHGDDQVRWMLRHWPRLPAAALRHLPPPQCLETAVSKQQSMELARSLGLPVLETVVCSSRAGVAAAAAQLRARDEVVLKGEGGAGGAAVRAVQAGRPPRDAEWRAVTRHAPTVLVQRRIRGPRYLVTVSYVRGVERAACVHEKVVAAPYAFGPAAFGVTRRSDVLHDYAAKMFTALQWHGIADIEFRQDLEDGRWYFMEINPRVCATLGIEAQAGLDLVGDWARVCGGRDADEAPGRRYRDGVRYAWAARAVALLASRPWRMPRWGPGLLASSACDFDVMDGAMRRQAVRTGLWIACHS